MGAVDVGYGKIQNHKGLQTRLLKSPEDSPNRGKFGGFPHQPAPHIDGPNVISLTEEVTQENGAIEASA
jgi:hypothetical protein